MPCPRNGKVVPRSVVKRYPASNARSSSRVRSSTLPVPSDALYARAMALSELDRETAFAPAQLDAMRPLILDRSRTSRLLSQHTSFMVVENSAQWEMLERKETQSLQGNHAMEFDEFQETPEPSLLLMLLLVLPLLVWIRLVGPSLTGVCVCVCVGCVCSKRGSKQS